MQRLGLIVALGIVAMIPRGATAVQAKCGAGMTAMGDACLETDAWTRVEPGGETMCAHGTPYAFWVRPGDPDKLLMYYQGGGGCWSADTCQAGSTFYDSSVGEGDNPTYDEGMLNLSRADNPFSDYTAVYMPSCTGDVYMGSNVQEYPTDDGGTLTIHHKGFDNAASGLAWAAEHVPAPETVFVTGCSAGSVGSAVHAPYVIEQYPEARVAQMGDSLSFTFHRPLDLQTDYHAHDHLAPWIPAVAGIEPGEFTMARYYAAIANAYPDVTFSEYNALRDRVQVFFYTAIGGDEANWVGDLTAALNEIEDAAPNFRSFTSEGRNHCVTPLDDFYRIEADGVRLVDWVRDLAQGREVENVRCEGCGQ